VEEVESAAHKFLMKDIKNTKLHPHFSESYFTKNDIEFIRYVLEIKSTNKIGLLKFQCAFLWTSNL
jgi:hypothetical protein